MPEQYRRPRKRVPTDAHPLRFTGRTAREISEGIEAAVADGRLPAGSPLPSVRSLAARLEVSPATVAAAVAALKRRGIVVSRPRSGLRVADRPPLAPARGAAPVPPGVRDAASGNPDPALLPDLRRALARGAALPPRLYGEEAVVPELRAVASAGLARDGVAASALCVVSGGLDGVERVLAAELEPGDPVAVEDPGFPGVLDLVRALGLETLPVALDERGALPEALAGALRAGARAVVLTPRGQNPTGAAFDPDRARRLGRVLARHPDAFVIEDDHLGPVAGAPFHTLTHGRGRWAVVRSVSKWLGPDLRLAVVAADERTVARVQGRQAVGPGWVSSLLQRAVAELWADEETAALAEQAATLYAGRRAAFAGALAERGIRVAAPSGLNVWVHVPDEDAVVRGLLAAGWAVAAGVRYRLAAPPAVRVTTAALRPAEAQELAGRLAEVLRPGSARTRAA